MPCIGSVCGEIGWWECSRGARGNSTGSPGCAETASAMSWCYTHSSGVRMDTSGKGHQKYPCTSVHARAASVQICTDRLIFARTCTDVHLFARSCRGVLAHHTQASQSCIDVTQVLEETYM